MPKFDYAPAPESRAIVSLRESYGLFIGGEFVSTIDGRAFKTISPATEEVLAEVTEAGPADVDRAVAAARQAYELTWSGLPPRERGKYLFRIARIVQERARELAVLESLEQRQADQGNPRDVDIPLVAAHFFYYAGWADKLEYAGFGGNPRPLGVAAQVIPWNFPLLMLAWKIAPALATGNTVVLKPAETTPLTALRFAEICRQAGLPPGGPVNILTGAGETGRALVEHPGVDKVAFTGSTEVGKQIARACATGPRKKVTLELGGKAANIVRVRGRALHRPGGRGDRQRDLLQPGARALRGLEAARSGDRCTPRSWPPCSAGWGRCGSATRWTRTPTWAPSTRPPSSPRSASCPTPARRRARSGGRRRASCP